MATEGVEVAFYHLTRCYISRVHAMFDTGANPTLFVNRQVTRTNETLFSLRAKVIDSCIDVTRPVIREHHLVQKIPHYFDKTTSSKPYLSQSVTPRV